MLLLLQDFLLLSFILVGLSQMHFDRVSTAIDFHLKEEYALDCPHSFRYSFDHLLNLGLEF